METKAQLEYLIEVGCDLVQGYYFFKPDPVDVSIYKFRHRSEDIPHETWVERLDGIPGKE